MSFIIFVVSVIIIAVALAWFITRKMPSDGTHDSQELEDDRGVWRGVGPDGHE